MHLFIKSNNKENYRRIGIINCKESDNCQTIFNKHAVVSAHINIKCNAVEFLGTWFLSKTIWYLLKDNSSVVGQFIDFCRNLFINHNYFKHETIYKVNLLIFTLDAKQFNQKLPLL